MTSYSRVYYQAYAPNGEPVGEPTSYRNAVIAAKMVGGEVRFDHADRLTRARPNLHNEIAREGCDRCFCGCKYWEYDRCIDCGTHVTTVIEFGEAESA